MDANVKLLIETTGCTETEAQQVLIESNNDVSRALKLLDVSSKEVIVFQLEFESKGKAEGTGYLISIFDLGNDNVLFLDISYPLSREHAAMLDINMPSTVFANSLRSSKIHLAERHRGTCASNAHSLQAKMSSHFVQKLINMHNGAQFDKINQSFGDLLKDAFGDDFTVQYFARMQSLGSISSLMRPKAASAASAGPQDAASKLFPTDKTPTFEPRSPDDIPAASPNDPLPQIVLICEPEIAPFNGKPAAELVEGEEIIVKIKDGRHSARYFAELLGGSINEELIPLIVPVVKVARPSETFIEAYVEFGPGIFGEFFIPPDVKIKTKAEGIEIYNPFQNDESLFADDRYGKQILRGLIFLIAAVFVLIVVLSLISLD